MSGKGGVDKVAGGGGGISNDDVDAGDIRRGGGGYDSGAVGGSAGSESEGVVRVQQRVEVLEKKIKS